MNNLIGEKYGRLTVSKKSFSRNGKLYWLCQCDCGNEVHIQAYLLRKGKTKSCGCLRKEIHTIHGDSTRLETARLYSIWHSMKQRCNNQNNDSYHNYGGRGIKVCQEWQEYIPFRNWALTNGYRDGLFLDRIDNDGDYCPENCKFSTRHQQQANMRTNNKTVGVHKFKSGDNRWLAHLEVDGARVLHKYCKTEEEAIAARKAAEKEYGIEI